jgi:Ankyrin repeats (3 copies)
MLILVAGLFALIMSSRMHDQEQSKMPSNEHIRDLIKTLPPESKLRGSLESGRHGDGIHYAWMDKMREQGVKRATVVLDFRWRNHPVDLKRDRILFFDKYDSDCSQITSAERLMRIQKSGLEQELEDFAREETRKSKWFYVDAKPRVKHGKSQVELADDPWVPTNPPILKPVENVPDSTFISIVALDDVAGLQGALQSSNISKDDLNKALFTASGVDDSCLISALLKAGANPNAQNSEGKTPLMYAAGFGSVAVVRALLNAGSSAIAKDRAGKNAVYFAEAAGHSTIVQLLRSAQQRN